DRHRRSPRWRGARSAQGVGHRTSRRHRHHPRRLGGRRAGPARTTDPRSSGHSAAAADRPSRERHRLHRGPRPSAARRRYRPGNRPYGQWLLPGTFYDSIRRTAVIRKHVSVKPISCISGFMGLLIYGLLVSSVQAAGSNMPWEAPLTSILESIQGPVARIVAVIIIIITGLSLAFGDTSGGFRRLIQIVFGLSIAFAASSFFLSFFSFGGGVLA